MATLRRLLWGLGVFTLAGVYLAVVSVSYRTRPSLDAGYLLLHGDDQPRQDGARGSHGNDEQLADALQHLGKELTRHTDGTLVIDFNCATRRHVRPDDDLPPPPSAAAALFEWASAANEALRVLNEDLFGSLAERPPQRVIVVQVHRRERYARWLLQSLAAVPGIESALLVLSHGHVDDALLGLAREVCFCRVARVFFPWSTQMWADCVNGSAAEGGRPCRRGPAFTDAKHHWWWLHNFVFNKVLDAAKYKGVTLFLEEDMYLSPDALHVLDRMQLAVPAADMYALSDDDGLLSTSRHRLVLQGHRVYNMGLALHERAWAKIVRCASMFCSLDDYNWDWSLQAVGVRCVPGSFTTATMRGARLFHTGKCGGMHFHGAADCDSLVLHARRLLQQNAELLFPDALTVQQSDRLPAVGRANGGWTDRRDQQLCLDNANASLHRWGQ